MNNGNAKSDEIPQEFPDHDEVLALHKTMKAGGSAGKRARNDLVVRNKGLVMMWANRFFRPGNPTQDIDDIRQAGMIGLMIAVDRFNPENGANLATYASWWIKQSIRRQFADNGRTVRVPVHKLEMISKIRRIAEGMSKNLGRRPTVEEIAEEVAMKVEDVVLLFDQAREATSLDDKMSATVDDGSERYNLVPDNNAMSPDLVSAKSDECDHLLNWVGDVVEHLTHNLRARDRGIVCHRYGLMGFGNGKVQEDVGALYSMTRERVSQICKKFFMSRSKLGLVIQSHYEMVQALKSITEGIELIDAAGLKVPPQFIRILGGQVYTVVNDDDDASKGPVRKVAIADTKAYVPASKFNIHRFLRKLKTIMVNATGSEESLRWLPAVALTDFNVRLSTSLGLSSSSEASLVQDILLVPEEKLASIRNGYTLELLDGNLREVWKKQGRLFNGQVAEAEILKGKVSADINKRDLAIKECKKLNPEIREAMMAWCGIDGTGRERDRQVFAEIAEVKKVHAYSEVVKCWEVVSMGKEEEWEDSGYWNLREELDILDMLIQ